MSESPVLYLTFDDGPDPEWTPRVLDLLEEAGMRATFFAIGEQALRSASLMRRIVAAGHEVGNHTFSHRHPWMMSAKHARTQVSDGARALSDVLGQAPRYYRPPHGRSRPCMSDEARAQGEQIVMWTLSAIDWGWLGTAPRIARRLERVHRRRHRVDARRTQSSQPSRSAVAGAARFPGVAEQPLDRFLGGAHALSAQGIAWHTYIYARCGGAGRPGAI